MFSEAIEFTKGGAEKQNEALHEASGTRGSKDALQSLGDGTFSTVTISARFNIGNLHTESQPEEEFRPLGLKKSTNTFEK
jgi:hypothetical protein